MAKTKFKLDLNGLRQLLKSEPMKEQVKQAAERVANTASNMSGEEYDSRAATLNYTSVATAFPNSKEAAHDNYENNTLLKALGQSKK